MTVFVFSLYRCSHIVHIKSIIALNSFDFSCFMFVPLSAQFKHLVPVLCCWQSLFVHMSIFLHQRAEQSVFLSQVSSHSWIIRPSQEKWDMKSLQVVPRNPGRGGFPEEPWSGGQSPHGGVTPTRLWGSARPTSWANSSVRSLLEADGCRWGLECKLAGNQRTLPYLTASVLVPFQKHS